GDLEVDGVESELGLLGRHPRGAQRGGALELPPAVIDGQIERDVLARERTGSPVDALGAGADTAARVAGLGALVGAAAAALVQTMAHGASMPGGRGAREHSCTSWGRKMGRAAARRCHRGAS